MFRDAKKSGEATVETEQEYRNLCSGTENRLNVIIEQLTDYCEDQFSGEEKRFLIARFPNKKGGSEKKAAVKSLIPEPTAEQGKSTTKFHVLERPVKAIPFGASQ